MTDPPRRDQPPNKDQVARPDLGLSSEVPLYKIIPIPKSGDTSKICNYRLISILCILSKVMETIVYSKIIDFIRPLLTRSQFGFLPNRSSVTQLLSCYYEALEGKNPVDILYLDIKKAFDSVPHHKLLYKLRRIGITGDLWQWMKGYLQGRNHHVYYKGNPSPCSLWSPNNSWLLYDPPSSHACLLLPVRLVGWNS